VKHFELGKLMFETCGDKHARAPLVVEFKLKGSDRRMWFMVNHLQRTDNGYRHCQAEMLNTWVKTNTVRMIAVGDYNFDWSVANNGETHDRGFDLIREGGRFKWIQPEPPIVRTHCGHHNSVLDFVFVTGRAREWSAQSRILKKEDSYYENNPKRESDHRPLWAQFDAE
jgi:endonuclease/exonuclease/phosphatase family metal-dependent hydrolase